jgi:hypothetical protein
MIVNTRAYICDECKQDNIGKAFFKVITEKIDTIPQSKEFAQDSIYTQLLYADGLCYSMPAKTSYHLCQDCVEKWSPK